ncbi:MAG: PKD domain-containing protein, partial [bacterium]|nr:PKD domain-containing protein [bacterium]
MTDAQGVLDTFTRNNYITVTDTDPTAGFTAVPTDGDEKLSVDFEDTTDSYDGVSWSWDFGDGNTSTEQDPTHIYDQDGTYSVTLAVAEADGDIDLTLATDIEVYETGPTANFSATPISGDEPLEVTFTDSSTSHDGIIAWDWDYGDGSAHDTTQNPTHTFLQDGSYTVILTVTEDAADGSLTSDAYPLTISVNDTGPTADFFPSPASSGTIPLEITFQDRSDAHDGVGSWIWDFDNDGLTDSSDPSPTFTFNQAGTY